MRVDRRGMFGAMLGSGLAVTAGSAVAAPLPPTLHDDNRIVGFPQIRTASGAIRGFQRGRIETFLGVPYAEPPSGALRFLPPTPAKPWSGVRDTLAFGHGAPFMPPAFQPSGTSQFGPQDRFLLYRDWTPHTQSEDCLRLNLWAPSGRRGLPVMVYMHGGGLSGGSGNDLLAYDGHNLADRGDVIVVTHNHRLNIFGFLDLSSFGGRWSESVNLGLLDIVEVLRWIRTNIEAFGGDPGNVTVFGQSGGGRKVSALMAMPAAKGLLHRGIVQSGSPGAVAPHTPNSAREEALTVLSRIGIGKGDLDKLQGMTAEQVAQGNVAMGLTWKMTAGVPNLPVLPGEASAAAQSVPLMVGTCLNESVHGVDNPIAATYSEADLARDTEKSFGPAGHDIAAAYRRFHASRTPFETHGAIEAAATREAALSQAAANHAVTGKAWSYIFAWRTPVLDGSIGSFHSADIAFAFNNATLCVNQTGGGPDAIALSHRVSDAWAAFARHGDPNHAGLPAWPSFGTSENTMMFDNQCRVTPRPEAEGRGIIARAKGG